jgi:hypothetical protein
MITDKELFEYTSLCGILKVLCDKFEERKHEVKELLNETAVLKRDAFIALAKANRFTRHLTGGQRQMAGLQYRSEDIKNKIKKLILLSFPEMQKTHPAEDSGIIHPELKQKGRSRGELKRMGMVLLEKIDQVKKTLLQLDLLEKRCRELIAAIKKAMEAFRHELKVIRRKIYPFGIFSFFYRFLRTLFGRTYFTNRDIGDVSALGNITGLVLKIADSPLI